MMDKIEILKLVECKYTDVILAGRVDEEKLSTEPTKVTNL